MSTTLVARPKAACTVWPMPRRPAGRGQDRAIDTLIRAVGGRIAALRKKRALTQGELADRVGVSQALLSAYELGKARIGADVVLHVAEALRVSTDEILGRTKMKDEGPIPRRRILRRLAEIDGLPRRKRDALMQMIEAFLGSEATTARR